MYAETKIPWFWTNTEWTTPNRDDSKWTIELKNGKQFRNIDSGEANRLIKSLNENENICFVENTKKIVRKVCIPVRNIQYIYTILENKDKTHRI